ncbi:hypothetical protein A3A20_01920 [Candidatus Wolfebacteria bacterium RIFCSPLOWO2_01_FULL_45_19]|uniref:Uncharacterized protein n=1 Tax=Candidatus Wolfebacteria bacterium RIFCSPLOWO2_01_FULL_45_19 TaxID=1802557 RepID=A0A1F8DSQ9_9BACT|nr:MAG: hypothetical protein UX23_C0001G0026 [Parcubacteria group bacterium GW2011_GWB1_45_9]OGM91673.1 MAG: hypothetical protein A3A20_01920 [Candidatus Wolfebacteria bacterium RIFCSPLOWO2_01_FULL_45_19]
MRFFLIFAFLIGIGVLLGAQSVNLFKQQRELRAEFAEVSSRLERLILENNELEKRIEYLFFPENLEKELRALNYKATEENLLILINE